MLMLKWPCKAEVQSEWVHHDVLKLFSGLTVSLHVEPFTSPTNQPLCTVS
jgi:hypothetical protein